MNGRVVVPAFFPFLLVKIDHELSSGPAEPPLEVSLPKLVEQIARPAFQIDKTDQHAPEMGNIGDTRVGTGERR